MSYYRLPCNLMYMYLHASVILWWWVTIKYEYTQALLHDNVLPIQNKNRAWRNQNVVSSIVRFHPVNLATSVFSGVTNDFFCTLPVFVNEKYCYLRYCIIVIISTHLVWGMIITRNLTFEKINFSYRILTNN